MSSLLEGLAIDAEDFRDLAHVLNVDRSAVERAVLTARPTTVAALVTEVRRNPTPSAPSVEPCAGVERGAVEASSEAPAFRTWG